MKKLLPLILTFFILTISISARAKLQGIAGKGGKDVKTSTVTTYQLLETYPLCTITVYLTGTTTIASIYSDNIGTVKANPFSSSSIDASWSFYANNGRYDIKFSGTGITSPYTLADFLFTDDGVIGPASATDNAIARFDGTTGKLIQNSVVTISDVGNIDSTTGKTFTFGDSTATDSARQIFRTQSIDVWHNNALTSNFTNGVTCGLTNYKDHTFSIGYNMNSNGTKINSSLVNFGLGFESKFCQSPGTAFQTEFYYTWTDPTNAISERPFGFVINHSNGDVSHAFNGDLNFARNTSNGSGQFGLLHENGNFDLSFLSTGAIVFKNNICGTGGVRFRNFAGTNTIQMPCLNSSDETVIGVGGGGSNVRVEANLGISNEWRVTSLHGAASSTTGLDFSVANVMLGMSGGSFKWKTDLTGFVLLSNVTFDADNTFDIGAGSLRPRDLFIGRNISFASQLTSTVSTGIAPFIGTSTTPVDNINFSSHPKVYNTSGTLQTAQKIVNGTGTLSGGTVVITFSSNAVFANTSYVCSGANQTNANAFKIVNTSASSITITGTGTDIIGFHCIGN